MASETGNNHNLIRCGDHSWAPWSIVCVHLMNGTSRDWLPINSNHPEVDYDWVCPDCEPMLEKEKLSEEDMVKLACVCIHCVRYLRDKYDSNYEEDNAPI